MTAHSAFPGADQPNIAAVRAVMAREEPVSLPDALHPAGPDRIDHPRDRRQELAIRRDKAAALAAAIAAAHPNDARTVLAAALIDLLPPAPIDHRHEDAAHWSRTGLPTRARTAAVLDSLHRRGVRRAELDALFHHFLRHPAFGGCPDLQLPPEV